MSNERNIKSNIQLFGLLFKIMEPSYLVAEQHCIMKFLIAKGVCSFEIYLWLSAGIKENTLITIQGFQ